MRRHVRLGIKTTCLPFVLMCCRAAASGASKAEVELCNALQKALETAPQGRLLVPRLLRSLSPDQQAEVDRCSAMGLVGLMKKHSDRFVLERQQGDDGTPGPWCAKLVATVAEAKVTDAKSASQTPRTGAEAPKPQQLSREPSSVAGVAAASSSAGPPAAAAQPAKIQAQEESADAIWQSIKHLIAKAPNVSQISSMYSALDPAMRKSIRTHHTTLTNFLRHLERTSGKVAVSDDGLRVCRRFGNTPLPNALNPVVVAPSPAPGSAQGRGVSAASVQTPEMRALLNDIANRARYENEPLHEVYQPRFKDFVPPPAPQPRDTTPEETRASRTSHESVLSAEMLIPLVPPFFVPMHELLTVMPEGYTIEHVQELFAATGALEIVRLEGQPFVRMHGGGTLINMAGNEAAVQNFQQYEPDPSLCDQIEPFLEVKGWTSLRKVIMSAPRDVVARLPYQRYKSLLFFAQMQHRFAFITDEEGYVARVRNQTTLDFDTTPIPFVVNQINAFLKDEKKSVESLVEWANAEHGLGAYGREQLIRYYIHRGVAANALQPAAAAEIPVEDVAVHDEGEDDAMTFGEEDDDGDVAATDVTKVSSSAPQGWSDDGRDDAEGDAAAAWSAVDVDALPPVSLEGPGSSRLPNPLAGTTTADKSQSTEAHLVDADLMWRMLTQHQGAFHIDVDTKSVQRMKCHENEQRRHKTLEEKLEEALQKNEKRDARKIRRKMAIAKDPDNPLIDPKKLAEAVASHLPRKSHISIKKFVNLLPPTVVDLFPKEYIKVFRNNPEFFSIFEFKEPGHLHVQRAGLELPEGTLRQQFDEEELIRQCAALLTKPRRMVDVWGRLSYGAKETIRKEYKTLFELLKRHPQYFTIVFRDAVRSDPRNAMVMLLQQPP